MNLNQARDSPRLRFWLRLLIRCKLLKELEAAIGIEPMNKGFAVRPGPLSPSVMECHRRVNIAFL
jgi:hypothetical protein